MCRFCQAQHFGIGPASWKCIERACEHMHTFCHALHSHVCSLSSPSWLHSGAPLALLLRIHHHPRRDSELVEDTWRRSPKHHGHTLIESTRACTHSTPYHCKGGRLSTLTKPLRNWILLLRALTTLVAELLNPIPPWGRQEQSQTPDPRVKVLERKPHRSNLRTFLPYTHHNKVRPKYQNQF